MAKLLTGTRVYGNATIDSILTVANVAATGTITVGANVSVNPATVFVGNSTVNTAITAGQVSASVNVISPFFIAPVTITSNYTIPTNYNAMTPGPVAVNTSVTVTVPSGSTWTIV